MKAGADPARMPGSDRCLLVPGTKGDAMERLLLSPSEVAELLGIGRSRVYEFLAAGTLPSIRLGRSIRIPVEHLREWIAQRAAGGEVVTAVRNLEGNTLHAGRTQARTSSGSETGRPR